MLEIMGVANPESGRQARRRMAPCTMRWVIPGRDNVPERPPSALLYAAS